MKRKIPVTNEIEDYVHCSRCIDELPAGVSPRDWASLEIGFTPSGIQVWCKRHECNVMHVDFEGCRHPANTEAQA